MSNKKDEEKEINEDLEESFSQRRLRRAVIREELVEITGDFLEGLILGRMLYWAERVRYFDVFISEEMQRRELDTELGITIEPLKGWFTKTAKQLNEELMLRMSIPTIRAKLKSLVEKQFLFERENPYQKRDRAKQYRISLLHLANVLDQKGYHLEGYPKLSHLSPNLNNLITISKISNKIKSTLSEDNVYGSEEPSNSHNNDSSRNGKTIPVGTEANAFILISHHKVESESVNVEQVHPLHHPSLADRVRERQTQHSNGAERHPKLEILPPREAMPHCLQVWFTLPLVTKPSAKTYSRIVRLIRQLAHGKFPAQYHSLNGDFTEQFKLTKAHLTRSWADADLANLLEDCLRPMIEDRAYWPENKEKYFKGLSFESFVFNARSGRSWMLSVSIHPPQLLRGVDAQQIIQQDLYPDATYELAETLEISRKGNPEQYAGIARNFSHIVQFLQLLPQDEERGGVFRFVRNPKRTALSLAEFLREQYHWVRDAGAGLIGLAGKPIRKWLEEWNDQEIRWPGQKRVYCVLDLLDEYNQHGRIRAVSEIVQEESASTRQKEISEEELDAEDAKQQIRDQTEHDRERQRCIDNLAPDDLIPMAEEEKEQISPTNEKERELQVAYGF